MMADKTDFVLMECPFCGQVPDPTDADCIYPVTRVNSEGKQVWRAGCIEVAGGCGAELIGWSAKEAVDLWNTRVTKNGTV